MANKCRGAILRVTSYIFQTEEYSLYCTYSLRTNFKLNLYQCEAREYKIRVCSRHPKGQVHLLQSKTLGRMCHKPRCTIQTRIIKFCTRNNTARPFQRSFGIYISELKTAGKKVAEIFRYVYSAMTKKNNDWLVQLDMTNLLYIIADYIQNLRTGHLETQTI